jgi:hypothetical protein
MQHTTNDVLAVVRECAVTPRNLLYKVLELYQEAERKLVQLKRPYLSVCRVN